MRSDHLAFVVGRLAKGDCRLVFIGSRAVAPIRGPWELRAVFTRRSDERAQGPPPTG